MTAPEGPTVEQRLQALEDKLAIYELVAAYGQGVDGGAADEVRGLFTTDGVLDAGGTPRNQDGLAELARMCGSLSYGYAHVAYLPIVVVDGDCATVFCHTNSLAQQEDRDEYAVRRLAADRWELKRVDGRWLVERRTARVITGSADSKSILAEGATARAR